MADQIKTVRSRINHRQNTLKELEQEEDTTAEKQRIRTKIKESLTSRYRCILKTRELMEKIITITIEQDKLILKRAHFESSVHDLRNQSVQADHEFEQLQRQLARAKEEFEKAKVPIYHTSYGRHKSHSRFVSLWHDNLRRRLKRTAS